MLVYEMDLTDVDAFCTNCQNFDRIFKGKAMIGYCEIHKVIVDGKKQYERYVCPFFSVDLGRIVIERKQKFKLQKDCWERRKKK